MYRKIDDFTSDWAYERASTAKVLGNLTDESLRQAVTPSGRTAGAVAWHIAQTIPELLGHAGITVRGPAEGAPVPASATAIASAYDDAAAAVPGAVGAAWTDEMLAGDIEMYGGQWTRGATLSILIKHEAHHRGQLTVLMRQAGVKVPGCYGPAREEWEAMGVAPLP